MDHGLDKAQNMKLVFCAFEQVSGLKINFHKSKLFCFSEAQEVAKQYAEMFKCRVGEFLLTYLGIPIHYRKLSNIYWKRVEERFEKKTQQLKRKTFFH
jgi:tRNA U34 2-thiouridine synthase MnmA/TrmU